MINDEEDLIRLDSFIAPSIIRKVVDEVHFFCFDDDTEPGLHKSLLERFGATETRHDSIESLIKEIEGKEKSLILDLDLDLFNREKPFYAEEQRIIEFSNRCTNLIKQAEVITIAKSPDPWYDTDSSRMDWDAELAEAVTEIVVPRILSIRNN